MSISTAQVERLLKGNYTFTMWSLSMMVTKLKGVYEASPASLSACANELNGFVNKYSGAMGADLAVIQKL